MLCFKINQTTHDRSITKNINYGCLNLNFCLFYNQQTTALIQQKVRIILQKSSLIHTNELFQFNRFWSKNKRSKHPKAPTAYETAFPVQLDSLNDPQPYKQEVQSGKSPQ